MSATLAKTPWADFSLRTDPIQSAGQAGSRPAQPASPASMQSGEDDRWGTLMSAALDGDGRAYACLLGEANSWLVRYFARRLPPSLVENAAQNTLLAIHSRRHTYQPGRPFRAWIAGIARYKWIDQLRSLGREPTASLDDELQEQPSVADHGPAVVSALVLHDLIGRLKPAQSSVIRLVKLDGCSIEEAAQITGQSASLVKVNIHRGLAKLRAIAQEDDD